jgi:penicillin-binding protein 1C
MILFFSAAVFSVFLFMKTPVSSVPLFEETRDVFRRSDAELLDRHGQVIHELRVDMEGRRLAWKALGNISPVLVKAVLCAEDRRFYFHRGADWMALGSASMRNVLSEKKRGASTVTMQLATLLKKELRAGRGKKDIALKISQIKMAIAIEKKWKKEKILEAYLNLVSFRGELQGITAASWGLFGKEPSGLNETESVILASLIRSPNAPVPEVIRRARSLAKALGFRTGKGEIGELAVQSLTEAYRIKRPVELAFNAALLLLSKERRRVMSTIDSLLQRFSAETLDQYVNILSPQNVSDGAVLVVHNRTGSPCLCGKPGRIISGPLCGRHSCKEAGGFYPKTVLICCSIRKKNPDSCFAIKR